MLPLDEWQPDDKVEMEAMLEKAARPHESWLAGGSPKYQMRSIESGLGRPVSCQLRKCVARLPRVLRDDDADARERDRPCRFRSLQLLLLHVPQKFRLHRLLQRAELVRRPATGDHRRAPLRLRYRAMVNRVSTGGLQVRQYFHRYTDDALDLCDVLGSYVPGGKVKLDEVSKILGLTGKPEGIDGSRVDEWCEPDKSRKWLGIVRAMS
jgi:Predicted 3'-5' exonuclease related to the exonuclease domain of PolB